MTAVLQSPKDAPVSKWQYQFETLHVSPAEIKRKSKLRPRYEIDQSRVTSYADLKRDAVLKGKPDPFPPPKLVRFDNGDLVVADGWHRIGADIEAGTAQIAVLVTDGTATDVLVIAGQEHATDQLGWTAADRKLYGQLLLKDPHLVLESDIRLAELVGVRDRTIARWRAELYPAEANGDVGRVRQVTRNGATYTQHLPPPAPSRAAAVVAKDAPDLLFDFGAAPAATTLHTNGASSSTGEHDLTPAASAPAAPPSAIVVGNVEVGQVASIMISWTMQDGSEGHTLIGSLGQAPAAVIDYVRATLRAYDRTKGK